MKIKIKLNLNLNSQIHCKFDLKSEIAYQIAKFLHLQIEKQRRFYFKTEKTRRFYLVFSDEYWKLGWERWATMVVSDYVFK